ncbi:3',5'-cyclic adenosine monophosphate phosphodiesterase CpdA [Kordia antarctica]|uniref:3',5'-cyclic adenosine monophosphate phosphodiesterase CpdA n=1 Tax=Kordia antarctica TaxID=1218801 RepID=A0A7L4ZQ49_9FLAO|nr:metallophosphoesterase [Kordia antarctica]QHI38651.1 3',5'-cyclic adenosine monophosphate phosphodiesterase CpdA [Kordia antarctica]
MRIVHLSDIHYSRDRLDEFKDYYFKALLEDLMSIHKERSIDLILITGDLIDKGGVSFEEENYYKVFQDEFLNPISKALSLSNEQIILIPGNHDVNEELIEKYHEMGLIVGLTSSDNVNEYISIHKDSKEIQIKRIVNYMNFTREFYSNKNAGYISQFETCLIYEKENVKVGFACLNSAWRCSSVIEEKQIWLGTNQILSANTFLDKENCNFKIALLHHPISIFKNREEKEILSFLKRFEFQAVLGGHLHESDSYVNTSRDGELLISNAKSGFNNPREKIESYQSGYSIIDYNFQTLINTVVHRKYFHNRIAFDKDLSFAKEGKFERKFSFKSKTNDTNTKEIVTQNDANKTSAKTNPFHISLDVLNNKKDFYLSNLFIRQDTVYNDFEKKLSSRGIVIIEGPQLSGKTEFIRNYFSKNDNYQFIDTIPEKIFITKKRKHPYTDVLDLYTEWGRAILDKATKQFNIDTTANPGIWELISEKEEFKKKIIANRDFSKYENDLECLFRVLNNALEETVNFQNRTEKLIMSAHLDNFESYADPRTFDSLIEDLGKLNLREVKDGILKKMGLVISTRYFPSNQLKNIVLKMNNFSLEDIKNFYYSVFEDNEKNSKEIIDLIYHYTNGHVWFVKRFFILFLTLVKENPKKSILELTNSIFNNPKYWIMDSFNGYTKHSEFIRVIEDIYNNHTNHQDDFYNCINEKNPNNERLSTYKNNSIVIETGILNRKKKGFREVIINGYCNRIFSDFYLDYLIDNLY